MFGLLICTGLTISGYSSFCLINSMKDMEKISKNKKDLIADSITPYGLNQQPDGKKCMISFKNTSRAGILEIFKRQFHENTRVIIDLGGIQKIGIQKIVTNNAVTWEHAVTDSINLSMGLNWFVPPSLKDVTKDLNSTISINGNHTALSNALENTYGKKYILPSGEYVAQFMSFEGKQIYSYGTVMNDPMKFGSNKFVSVYMGLDPQIVADHAFEEEQSLVDTKCFFSGLGIAAGVFVISSAFSECK